MLTIDVVWAVAIGYLFGSLPSAYILCKLLLKGLDIRTVGSKNVGGRNLIRALKQAGKPDWFSYSMGVVILVFDVLKGYLAMLLVQYLSIQVANGDLWVIAFAGVAAVLGHNWNIWLFSPGGKGVATSMGVLIFFNPIYIPIWLVGFFVIGCLVLYSAITYILNFIAMGVVLYYWNWYVTPISTNYDLVADLPLVAMITLFALTVVVLSRQYENFAKIKSGEASKMKLWKIFKGKAEEALK